jgi:MFS family permease
MRDRLLDPQPFNVGDRVREADWRVPDGCRPFCARVEAVAPDGWVSVRLGGLANRPWRRPMIAGTYILSGVLLLVTGYMFDQHQLTAGTLTLCWSVVFFFASAGVSAAYLTVSEIFPMETRALAIALFYAVGTGIGGIVGPQVFGRLIPTGKTSDVFFAWPWARD